MTGGSPPRGLASWTRLTGGFPENDAMPPHQCGQRRRLHLIEALQSRATEMQEAASLRGLECQPGRLKMPIAEDSAALAASVASVITSAACAPKLGEGSPGS